jgi:hypothetical protein
MRHVHVQLDTLDLVHPTDGLKMFEPARVRAMRCKGESVSHHIVLYQRPRLI